MLISLLPRANAELLEQLKQDLGILRVQDLRQAAKTWGWKLRGAAKDDLLAQMTGYLSAAGTMPAAIAALPSLEQQILAWLSTEDGFFADAGSLRPVLERLSGETLDPQDVYRSIDALVDLALVIRDENRGFFVANLIAQWLPRLTPPGLVVAEAGPYEAALSVSALNDHVESLLSFVETMHPAAPLPAPPATGELKVAQNAWRVAPRGGLAMPKDLADWGYKTGEEQNLARFILDLLLAEGLIQARANAGVLRLALEPDRIAGWQDTAPSPRQQRLRERWLGYQAGSGLFGRWPAGPPERRWNELDLALQRTSDYTFCNHPAWQPARNPEHEIGQMRLWLLAVSQILPDDVWLSYPRFLDLLRSARANLHFRNRYGTSYSWFKGEQHVQDNEMDAATWSKTYGTMVEAFLAGPARWLGIVDIARSGDSLLAFRRPKIQDEPDAMDLPGDALCFPADSNLTLRNLWQAGVLRQLILLIAAQTGRDRQFTTYQLDPATFRQTLRKGGNAEQIIGRFAEQGFPLPGAIQQRLRTWEARAGRYQVYGKLAAIEFADAGAMAETLAVAGVAGASALPISERCLVLLEPDQAPALLETLRRQGFTPKVLS